MISYLEGPREDETLASVAGRALQRAIFPVRTQALAYLFGSRSPLNLEVPKRLDLVAQSFGRKLGLSVEDLVQQCTMLPLFAPFAESALWKRVLQGTRGESNESPASLLTYHREESNGPRYLRFCLKCQADDKRRFGYSWWRRTHQKYGVECCPTHEHPLCDSQFLSVRMWKSALPLADDAVAMRTCARPSELTLAIASNVRWMLGANLSPIGHERIRAAYLSLLQERGLVAHGRLLRTEFLADFTSKVGKQAIEQHAVHEEPEVRVEWPARLALGRNSGSRVARHLCLFFYLGKTAEQFMQIAREIRCEQFSRPLRRASESQKSFLRRAWSDRSYTQTQLQDRLNVSFGKLCRLASELGLQIPRGHLWSKNKRKRFTTLRRTLRADFIRLQRGSRTIREYRRVSRWLARNDRDWFTQHRAARRLRERGLTAVIKEVDQKLAGQIPYLAARIRAERPFRRVNVTTLSRQLRTSYLRRRLPDLPKCRAVLKGCVETLPQFVLRRVQMVRSEHPTYSAWRIAQAASVPRSKIPTEVVRALRETGCYNPGSRSSAKTGNM